MEITNIEPFLEYYARVRERTRRLVLLIPDEHLEWSCRPGKFTLGDQVRHIAAIERWLYAETLLGRPAAYRGCGRELADGKQTVLEYLDQRHRESLDILAQLTPERLQSKILTPTGSPIRCWKWLRLLPEHEIHHRGQIYLLLGLLGVPTPPLYGLTSEDVIEQSKT